MGGKKGDDKKKKKKDKKSELQQRGDGDAETGTPATAEQQAEPKRLRADEEEMLPRGGKAVKVARALNAADDADEAFALAAAGGDAVDDDDDDADDGPSNGHSKSAEGRTARRRRRVHVLTRGNVTVGALALAVVTHVLDSGLRVDLPHGMEGFAADTHISAMYSAMLDKDDNDNDGDDADADNVVPTLSDMFAVGDIVPVAVLGFQGHQVTVTLDPDTVAQYLETADSKAAPLRAEQFALGVVQSREDKGWVVQLAGGSGAAAFCPAAAVPFARWAVRGRPVMVSVTRVSGRVTEVAAAPRGFLAPTADAQQSLHDGAALLPGMYVFASHGAATLDDGGVSVALLGTGATRWHGHMHFNQRAGDRKTASERVLRVLWVDPARRAAGLTAAAHLVRHVACVAGDALSVRDGTRVMRGTGTVTRVDSAAGVWLTVDGAADRRVLFAPQGLCDALDSYHVGQRGVPYRLVRSEMHLIDRTLRGALSAAVLRLRWACAADVPLGAVLEGARVTHVDRTGTLQVRLDGLVEGFVPRHAAPTPVPSVGATLRARVIDRHPSGRLLLSCRAGMLAPDSDAPLTPASAAVGRWGRGIVYEVRAGFALIRFFGGLTGHAHASQCAAARVTDLASVLHVGQTVRARVTKLRADNATRVEVSLLAGADAEGPFRPLMGSTVRGRVTTLLIGDDSNAAGAELQLQSGDTPPRSCRAFLPLAHMADWPRLAADTAAHLRVDQMLDRLLVVGYEKRAGVLVSLKPSLALAARGIAAGPTEAPTEAGVELPALFVRTVTPGGIVLSAGRGWTAFCHRNQVSDAFVAPDAALPWQPGTTLAARVRRAGHDEQGRVQLRVSCAGRYAPPDLGAMVYGYLARVAARCPPGLAPGVTAQARVLTLGSDGADSILAIRSSDLMDHRARCVAHWTRGVTWRLGQTVSVTIVNAAVTGDDTLLEVVPAAALIDAPPHRVVSVGDEVAVTTGSVAGVLLFGLAAPEWSAQFLPSPPPSPFALGATLFGAEPSRWKAPKALLASCRIVRLLAEDPEVVKQREPAKKKRRRDGSGAPALGDTVSGVVVEREGHAAGLYVQLASGIVAHVPPLELADDPSLADAVKRSFPVGAAVDRARVIRSDKRTVLLSLKASSLSRRALLTLDGVREGSALRGTVTRVEPFGVFVALHNSAALSGLAHKTQLCDAEPNADPNGVVVKTPAELFSAGDYVVAKVVGVARDTGRISLSLRKSLFSEADLQFSDSDDDDDNNTPIAMHESDDDDVDNDNDGDGDDDGDDDDNVALSVGDLDALMAASDDVDVPVTASLAAGERSTEKTKKKEKKKSRENSAAAVEDAEGDSQSKKKKTKKKSAVDDAEDDSQSKKKKKKSAAQTPSAVALPAVGFFTAAAASSTAASHDSDGADDDADDDANVDAKKSAAVVRDGAAIERRESLLAARALRPVSDEDYERALLGEPGNAELWVRWMAARLAAQNKTSGDATAAVAGARAVANKALSRIDAGARRERLNVWTALINLEARHGGAEGLAGVAARAAREVGALDTDSRILDALEAAQTDGDDTRKNSFAERAERHIKTMLKTHSGQADAWLRAGQYYIARGEGQRAAELLQRALAILPDAGERVMLASRWAQYEFKHGSAERGRTVFHSLLDNYPKRIDLLVVFLDMEEKAGDVAAARRLYQRAAALRLSSKKMRYFLRRWLAFEQTHGTQADVARVTEMARAYVDAAAAKRAE